MTIFDWKAEIARMAYWKQVAAERDTSRILPWHLPRVAATKARIKSAELATGITFPSQFRDFLEHADGWPAFHISTDLFGVEELLSNRWKSVLEREEVASFLAENDFEKHEVLPIGASDVDLEVFLLISPDARRMPGNVIWFVSEEIDIFDNFEEFFSSMVKYNSKIAEKLKSM